MTALDAKRTPYLKANHVSHLTDWTKGPTACATPIAICREVQISTASLLSRISQKPIRCG